MILTKRQEDAIKISVERYKNKNKYTVISGYAGSGKSTIIPYIVNALGLYEDDVVYAAYTGKAALVLKNKGCKNAMTLHKLLYIPKKLANGDVEFIEREHLECSWRLIVVDEVSMVPLEMWNLLMKHNVYVVATGDPGQLPPVEKNSNNHLLDKPHCFLNEIMRQAQDSGIIRLSMDIRSGNPLKLQKGNDVWVIEEKNVTERMLLGADIVICGRNDTRRKLNKQIRKLKWGDKYTDKPINGDKLICLHNRWKITDMNDETPLVNGMIGEISRVAFTETKNLHPKMTARFTAETGEVFRKDQMSIDYQLLLTGNPTVNKDNWRDFYKVVKPIEIDSAEAVTCHKYQGSQADRVVVFCEPMGDKEQYFRWLYTAATRSAKKLVMVI